MRLCMFHPNDQPMERGWVGRIDGDRMIHLAAQTLQSFFLTGGTSREHAEYPLAETTLLVPVQYPPTVRLFDERDVFRFGNATAVVGDGTAVTGGFLRARARIAAVVGAEGAIGGFSALLEWVDPAEEPAVKASDFGLVLGPVVVTPDEADPARARATLRGPGSEVSAAARAFAWDDAVALAGRRTMLRPGDLLVGPVVAELDDTDGGVELEVEGIGVLRCPIA
jgi:hypothetical protein